MLLPRVSSHVRETGSREPWICDLPATWLLAVYGEGGPPFDARLRGWGAVSRVSSPGKVSAQLRGREALRIRGRSHLVLTPALSERAGVDRIEADLVDQPRHRLLRLLVIARDGDAHTVGIAGRTTVVA